MLVGGGTLDAPHCEVGFMVLPQRKPNRLLHFDYSTPGAYFVTICTQGRKCILGEIVGGGTFDAPKMQLSHIGNIVYGHILSGNKVVGVRVDKFVIMPNHIHIILLVDPSAAIGSTPANAVIPRFISAFKRFSHRDAGFSFFQRSYHDHIIRSEKDYLEIWQYIDNNPAKWEEDCFYRQE